MQKILATTLAAAVSIMLITGCGGSGEVVDTTTPAETKEAPAQQPKVAKPATPTEKPVAKPAAKVADTEVQPAADKTSALSMSAQEKVNELTRVYFEFDKAQITTDTANTLKQNAAILKAIPGVKIVIEGHCDERGTTEYNLALGERRANAVKTFLVDSGVAENRLATLSMGEEMPLMSESNEQAWAKNRRAEFKLAK